MLQSKKTDFSHQTVNITLQFLIDVKMFLSRTLIICVLASTLLYISCEPEASRSKKGDSFDRV